MLISDLYFFFLYPGRGINKARAAELVQKPAKKQKVAYPKMDRWEASYYRHGHLYRWMENSFPILLYLKPVEISKKCFNII